jgi:hypothetical protein
MQHQPVVGNVLKALFTSVSDAKLRKEYEELHRIADKMLPSYRAKFLTTIKDYKDSASIKQLEQGLKRGDSVDALLAVFDRERLQIGIDNSNVILRRGIEEAAEASSTFLPEKIVSNLNFNLINEEAVFTMRTAGARLVSDISLSTQRALAEAVASSIESGMHPSRLARQIKSMVGLSQQQVRAVDNYRFGLLNPDEVPLSTLTNRKLSAEEKKLTAQVHAKPNVKAIDKLVNGYADRLLAHRANVIARTETIWAANKGQQILWDEGQEQGLISPTAKRQWITTPDDRLCPICKPIPSNNPGGVAVSESFQTSIGSREHPPAHPMCRCAMRLIL